VPYRARAGQAALDGRCAENAHLVTLGAAFHDGRAIGVFRVAGLKPRRARTERRNGSRTVCLLRSVSHNETDGAGIAARASRAAGPRLPRLSPHRWYSREGTVAA
jgi:hypothetical protein